MPHRPPLAPVEQAPPPVADANPAFAATVAVPEPATPVESFVEESPAPRVATPSTPPTKQQFWRPPLRLRVTQRGVIDLAAVLAHTGSAAASIMPPGVDASPIVGVGDGSEAAPEVAGPPPRPPSDPPPPAEPVAARPESVVPRRPAPLPNARTLVGHLAPEASRGESPMRPRSEPPARAQSEPPARAQSDPPRDLAAIRRRAREAILRRARVAIRRHARAAIRRRGHAAIPPARPRSDPPARPRSDPPLRPRSDPPEQQRARDDVPDGVIALRDVPSGWSPDPSIGGSDSVEEFRAIREQLYRFAVRGCFVVGVSSSPDAIDGKSRIAARLATVLAEPARARVLLMEGDFDGPAVHRLMRIEMPLASGIFRAGSSPHEGSQARALGDRSLLAKPPGSRRRAAFARRGSSRRFSSWMGSPSFVATTT